MPTAVPLPPPPNLGCQEEGSEWHPVEKAAAGPLLKGRGRRPRPPLTWLLLGACKPDKETAGETPVCSFSLLPTHSTALPSRQDTYSPSHSGCLIKLIKEYLFLHPTSAPAHPTPVVIL